MRLRKKLWFLTLPASLIFGIVTGIRNWLFDNGFIKQVSFTIPVISVGNITVGGTGKTPHVEYLINLLQKDYELSVLSRGYKRKTKGYQLAGPKSGVADIGDEPKQIKQKFPSIQVAVSEDRIEGINRLLEEKNKPDVILLDDAYQHRYIKPGLTILLIDYNRPLASDYYLPFGNLRENRYQTRRAQIIIITKTPVKINPIEKTIFKKGLRLFPFQKLFFSSMIYDEPVPVFKKNASEITRGEIAKQKMSILLVTGIANPEPLVNFIHSISKDVVKLTFPDHHNYTEKDIAKISDHFKAIESQSKIIITTEKDAMHFREIKYIPNSFIQAMYFIPVKVKFLEDADLFNRYVIDYLRKNKPEKRG
jgi:tetraacyldisaccharide 4'-kinase